MSSLSYINAMLLLFSDATLLLLILHMQSYFIEHCDTMLMQLTVHKWALKLITASFSLPPELFSIPDLFPQYKH